MENAQLPQYLFSKIKNQYGDEITNKVIEGYNKKRFVTLRVNTLSSNKDEIVEFFNKNDIEYEIVSWSDIAFIIKNKTEQEIEEYSIYKEGKVYLQSLSSMLPPIILNPQKGKDILDMCAAPGGKTTQMAAITNDESFITACEMNKIRSDRLKYNLIKQGVTHFNLMQIDARNLDDYFSFDAILVDAPCSGSGTIQLNCSEEIRFTGKFEEKLEKTQLALLKKAINLLKKGEELVYSTCSILYRENENIVEKVLKEKKVEVVPIELNNVELIPKLPCKVNGALCVMPNELYEGFFVVKLKKI